MIGIEYSTHGVQEILVAMEIFLVLDLLELEDLSNVLIAHHNFIGCHIDKHVVEQIVGLCVSILKTRLLWCHRMSNLRFACLKHLLLSSLRIDLL